MEGSSARDDVWVIVPAYNDAAELPRVVAGLEDCGYHVVVVDDGSKAPLLSALSDSRAHVLRHAINMGQGAALQTGISYALQCGAGRIVTFDADGQHQHEDIPALLRPLDEGAADVALGTRFAQGGRAVNIPKAKRKVLALATLFTRLTIGISVTDTHNGLRAFTAEAASRMDITQNRMAHASQILSRIKEHRLRFQEVPVTVLYSEYSVRKGQRISNIFNILWDFMKGVLYP